MQAIRNNGLAIRTIGVSAALFASLVAGGIFIASIGRNPLDIYGMMLTQSLGNPYGIGQILFKASTLTCTGLSVALCLRAGYFNIGGEGQIMIGALAMALAGCSFPNAPAIILLPACLVTGLACAAIWGAIPGVLKGRTGANEVITSIMLNFIAADSLL